MWRPLSLQLAHQRSEDELAGSSSSESRRNALSQWVSETSSSALAYAVSLVGNHAVAEDLVHDCYGRLLEKADSYDLVRDGRRLLFRAITNACINWTRRRSPLGEVDRFGEPEASADVAPPHQAAYRELEEAIAAALDELDVRQRAVIELRALGHSLVEVAGMLELSESHTRVLLHRARQRLAKRLQPFLEEKRT